MRLFRFFSNSMQCSNFLKIMMQFHCTIESTRLSIRNNAIFDFRKLLGRWRLSKSLIDYHLKLPSITFSPKNFLSKLYFQPYLNFCAKIRFFLFLFSCQKIRKKNLYFFPFINEKNLSNWVFKTEKTLGQKMLVWNSVQS